MQKGLKTLKSRNPNINRVLSYRLYRLTNTKSSRNGRETAKVKDHLVRLEITMRKCKFSPKDPVGIIGFLEKFVRECNMLEMTEAQALLAVTEFLSGTARSGLESARDQAPGSETAVTTWPEAVNYLLSTLVSSEQVHQLEDDLAELRQKPGEEEDEFGARVDEKLKNYGHAFDRDDKAAIFVKGLDERIRTVVDDFREEKDNEGEPVTFSQLVKKARVWGKSLRAGKSADKKSTNIVASPKSPRHRSQALSVEQSSPDSHAFVLTSPQDSAGQVPHYQLESVPWPGLSDSGSGLSLPAGDATISSDSDNVDPTLLMYGRQRYWTPAPRIPAADGDPRLQQIRPGWPSPPGLPPTPGTAWTPRTGAKHLICHTCYQRGHVSPECPLPARDLPLVVSFYEALSDAEKNRVPAESYLNAKARFAPASRPDIPQQSTLPQASGRPISPVSRGTTSYNGIAKVTL